MPTVTVIAATLLVDMLVLSAMPEQKGALVHILFTIAMGLGFVAVYFVSKAPHYTLDALFLASLGLFANALVGVDDAAQFFDISHRFPEYDTLLHYWGGLCVGIAARGLWPRTHGIPALACMIGLTLAVGMLWETMEFFALPFIAQGFSSQEWLFDTVTDLIIDAMGASSLFFVPYLRRRYGNTVHLKPT